jgi:ABC-2 type transport system ATP-binding protein
MTIRTERLRKEYRRQVAVKELDLAVPAGRVFGFLGPNGAGKTTTIMMLLGNVRPTAGRAWLLGKPVGDVGARRRVGFLPEKFQFHDFLTATEFLRLHGRLSGMDRGSLQRRIPETLSLVGLEARARSPLREFSKGMQQRIGLAQAILHDPDVVILDEPTSALDPLGRREVRDVIRTLKERGKTVFLNSHLLSEIEQTCDEVAILKSGEVVAQGPLADLLGFSSRVDLEVRGLTDALWERLRPLCPHAERQGDRITAYVAGETGIPALARAVVEGGGDLVALTPHRESLEELFVRLIEQG